ncbi:MAG: apolipoprotein N-acyltransferase [Myxococcales bacterium]|nr:apolipoprotein N-acyltransferase [Myxococcales bacterium]MCB9651180.1 apolipoprotein N-acyltransferase [Deltaproteobacteria bacterium]
MSLPRQLALAALGGVLYFTGFVGFGVWPNTFLLFVPVLFALEGTTPRRALLIGVVFGLVTNSGGYYWVIHLLTQFADLALPLALLGYLLLCLYQGSLLAVVVWLVRKADADLGIAPVWSLPVAFIFAEHFYPLLFPSYVGNSLYTVSVLTQIVDVTGMTGLTALICLVNGAIYEVLSARLRKRKLSFPRVVVPAAALALTLIYGVVQVGRWDARIAAAPTIKAALVQTNLGAKDKAGKRDLFIRRHQDMTRELLAKRPDLDLVVWPESAYNRYIQRDTRSVRRAVTDGIDVPVIFGALTYERGPDGEPDVYNTAVLTSSTGQVLQLFDKVELLMFGETIPLVETFPQIEKLFPRSGTFTRGKTFESFRVPWQGHAPVKVLPMICYEDIIPTFVRRVWREGGPAAALVNVTNDSWYGDTHEPLIHLVLASFRSIETRRALMRSTNTGISAFVDPVGRITQRTGQWTQETLVADVPVIEDGESTVYMKVGEVLPWLSFTAVAAGFVVAGRRRKRR